ncbi:MAG: divergent polysaccharide deacetylase family protein [Deltaproteobacteria bacterium]|nr:divergent polysaccharide deacetylase family protein [Deltaproteobacteria bacterium]
MRPKKRRFVVRSVAILLFIMTALTICYVSDIGDREAGKQTGSLEEKQRSILEKGTSSGSEMALRDSDRDLSKDNILPAARIKIAILIDDIGYDIRLLRELIKIDAPLTFAVLPYNLHSVDAARVLHAKGKEVILHLPMEPHTYPDEQPGAGALFIRMDGEAIRKQIEEDIAAVPFVSGVNNHMGSRFMEDEGKLSIVFDELKKRNLFFIDSRTTPSSKAEEAAKTSGIPFISRKIFIDTERNYTATLQNLMNLSGKAYGYPSETVLAIGHPYPDTIRALQKAIPVLKAKGVVIVPVSDLVK